LQDGLEQTPQQIAFVEAAMAVLRKGRVVGYTPIEALKSEIAEAELWWLAGNFLDLSEAMSSAAGLAAFTDAVHLDDAGQTMLAAALAAPVGDRLSAAIAHHSGTPPSYCRWIPSPEQAQH
jgi:hypothetical protein